MCARQNVRILVSGKKVYSADNGKLLIMKAIHDKEIVRALQR